MALKVQSFQEVVDEEIPDVASIMGDGVLIPGGAMVVAGPSQTYKSFLIQDWLFALAEGRDWMGFKVAGPRTTLYVQVEITRKQFQKRSRWLQAAYPTCKGGRAFYAHAQDWMLDTARNREELEEAIKSCKAEVCIIDPLNLTLSGSENSDEDTRYYLRSLNKIRQDLGVLVGFVHHVRKGQIYEGKEVDAGQHDVRGHGNLNNWPDTILRTNLVSPSTIECRWLKLRNSEPLGSFWLRFDRDTHVLREAEDDPKRVLLSLLASGPVPKGDLDKQVIEETGIGINKARDVRKELHGLGLVEEVRDPENRKRVLVQKVEG